MNETEPSHLPHMSNQPNDAAPEWAVWPDGSYLGKDEGGDMYDAEPEVVSAIYKILGWLATAIVVGSALAAVYA